jgi:hypothetical protein
MQKKKPSFQVIPNYGVGEPKTGMNLKKCLRNKAATVVVGAAFRPPQAYSVRLIAIAKLSKRYPIRAELPASSYDNGAAQWRGFGVNMAALFIELSGKI